MLRYVLAFIGILFFLVSYGLADETSDPNIYIGESYYLTTEDNPEFSSFVADKTNWQEFSLYQGLQLHGKNAWLQMSFDVQESDRPQGIFISMLGSYEAYWDGVLIGRNGVIGRSNKTEQPGDIDKVILIPQHLFTTGVHNLSLKISTHHNSGYPGQSSFWCLIGDYNYFLMFAYKRASLPMTMSAALFLIALYCIVLYVFTLKEISYLLFSGLCTAILSLIIVESWRGLWGYTYDWQIPRLIGVLALSSLIAHLLVLFFTFFFRFEKRKIICWCGLGAILQAYVLFAFDGYDDRSLYIFLIGIVIALAICCQAAYQKNKDAKLMLIGLLLFLAPISIDSFSYMDQYFFISFSALILLILYRLTQTMQIKQRQLIQSQINAGRLELELVKRNLQPHFILNTLTAVEEWIEDSPKQAVMFIQALAREFRYMAQISSKSLISLTDEIALCQSHIKVMEFRSNIQFSMKLSSSNLHVKIPPGILLTLIENAISHNNYSCGIIEFTVEQVTRGKRCILLFSAPVNHKSKVTAANTGIGSQYIEARLNESFFDKWHISTKLSETHWTVNIDIPLFIFDKAERNIGVIE
ncbi:sensor histidine kinase [Agarilytica rhodophyticola]|uniref:sensor histidine kinase n=1 Tax=Agarilytica rhodophyticola TaxID=1737490 RepID=UPI00131A1A26|nr:histidine kinase [Agarilytica rhodophyticola]